MGDEFDACECIWSHELAMRRLLSMIRQGQSYCTDNICVDASAPVRDDDTAADNFTFMTMFFVFAVILYLFRPRSVGGPSSYFGKSADRPIGGNGGPNNDPPPPPTTN